MFFDPSIFYGLAESYKKDCEERLAVQRKLWDLLPKKEAAIAEAKWHIEQTEIRERHARQLELAAASRPKNFWGN